MSNEHGEITTLVKDATAVNLVAAACLSMLLYDHLLTLDEEIAKIWPAKLSQGKILFIMNRYVVEALILFNCIAAAQYDLTDGLHLLHSMAFSNMLNFNCLCARNPGITNKQFKWALFLAYFAYFGGIITLTGLVIQDYVGELVILDPVLSKLPNLPGCYTSSAPPMIAGLWIVPLVTETILFLLVIQRAYWWWRDGMAMPRIVSMLARDSTWYFFIVFALLLANFMAFEVGPPTLSNLFVVPSTTAGCILGSHMMLHMRSAIDGDDHDDEDPVAFSSNTPKYQVWSHH